MRGGQGHGLEVCGAWGARGRLEQPGAEGLREQSGVESNQAVMCVQNFTQG